MPIQHPLLLDDSLLKSLYIHQPPLPAAQQLPLPISPPPPQSRHEVPIVSPVPRFAYNKFDQLLDFNADDLLAPPKAAAPPPITAPQASVATAQSRRKRALDEDAETPRKRARTSAHPYATPAPVAPVTHFYQQQPLQPSYLVRQPARPARLPHHATDRPSTLAAPHRSYQYPQQHHAYAYAAYYYRHAAVPVAHAR
ncbi:hypothetical protein EXIGLDRAFT_749190 [Exidia glandulosa HHB12029]|uniref:Uncharacterized protein n=1 Tax=Exidia glandulosa HHB12029 TaxID=1314781 RepID=A0A165IG69_EXIGL|nr:hypothetical protein EXIGLDRAFT_749190 [Exidia glandulosa HHB12029]